VGRTMSADFALLIFLLAPFAHAAAVGLVARIAIARDGLNVLFALAYAALALVLLNQQDDGYVASLSLAQPLPGADFAFAPEPLGLIAAATLAIVGALNAPFAAGYYRALEDRAPARAHVLTALSIGMACAAALAANLFTFLLCSLAMVVASFPLVAHLGDAPARRAARVYLAVLLTASVALLLPAMAWTHALAGRLDFVGGGLLAGRIGPVEADVLLALFAFGFAAAAIMPLHLWLPAAMRAPAPAAGAVHAVAAASIGALGLIKVSALIFGRAMAAAAIARPALFVLALAGACAAALIALSKDDLKTRLGYATVGHIALCSAGAMIAGPTAIFAAAFQIVAHGLAKASLFFTVGAAEAVTGRTRASELLGLGRRMPWAFAAFALAALSLAGCPPLAGAWPVLWLSESLDHVGMTWGVVLVLASAALNFATFGPLAARALFGPTPSYPFDRPDAASPMLIVPVAVAGLALLGLLALVDPLSRFIGVRLSP
jgi:multicomponent Na+:H+ antiporter subunit D